MKHQNARCHANQVITVLQVNLLVFHVLKSIIKMNINKQNVKNVSLDTIVLMMGSLF